MRYSKEGLMSILNSKLESLIESEKISKDDADVMVNIYENSLNSYTYLKS